MNTENKSEERKRPCLFRRIAGDLLLVMTAALTADLTVVMLQRIRTVVLKDTYRTVFSRELILCLILLLFALDLRFGILTRCRPRVLRALGWLLRVTVTALSVLVLLLGCRALVGCLIDTSAQAEHAIVLGMALEDGKPTGDLLLRLDTAKAYLERCPGARLILTGGNPDPEGRTEAAVMRDLLAERGVAEEKLLLEDRAETTEENFANAARMIDPSEAVVLISSDYHMERASRTAKEAGFSHVLRLPAPSEPRRFVSNLVWEVMMELNSLKGKLGL